MLKKNALIVLCSAIKQATTARNLMRKRPRIAVHLVAISSNYEIDTIRFQNKKSETSSRINAIHLKISRDLQNLSWMSLSTNLLCPHALQQDS